MQVTKMLILKPLFIPLRWYRLYSPSPNCMLLVRWLTTGTIQNALAEFVRRFFSKRAQKTYLGIVLFLTVSTLMILVSAIAYGIFYYRFIPQVGLERVVHLQFGLVKRPHARGET